MLNYYEMFNLSPSASPEEIKMVIHHQLRLWSQRTNAPQIDRRQEAERMMRVLEEMETILLDDQKRAEYDQVLQMERVETVVSDENEDQTPTNTQEISQEELEEKLKQGWQFLEQGKVADALFLAIQLTDRFKDHAEVWSLLGQARFAFGEVDEAIKPMVKASDLDSKNPTYAFTLGKIFEKLGKLDRAEDQYKLALALDPVNTTYKYTLGTFYVKTKRVREGLRILEQCLTEDPDNPDYRRELARAYLEIACSNWKVISPGHPYLPAGRYPTDQVDMTMAEVYINRANAIPFDDDDLRKELHRVKTDIQKKKGRKFTGSWTAAIISFISLFLTNHINPSWLNTLFIFLPFIYVASALTPHYRIYRKGIQGESSRTDFAYLFERLKDRYGNMAYFIMSLIYLLYLFITAFVLSIVIIYNFYRNYPIQRSKA